MRFIDSSFESRPESKFKYTLGFSLRCHAEKKPGLLSHHLLSQDMKNLVDAIDDNMSGTIDCWELVNYIDRIMAEDFS